MKKLVHLFIVGFLLLGSTTLMAQCPPPDNSAGVNNFTTQTEIDNYIVDYPNCTELTVFVNIYDEEGTTDPITNLNGLANLERIDGSIKIYNTSQLTDLTGLSGLIEITRGMAIYDNTGLESLDGIENLTAIGTGDSFNSFDLYNNESLTDITALQNVDEGVINWLTVYDNTVLTSLEGMDNMYFDPTTLLFRITDNPNLSICEVESICTYITEGGNTDISGNALGCENIGEITTNCQIAFPNCPEGDVTLTTQAEVDQFLVDYPNCAVIPGTLTIDDAGADPIVNLDGLQNIETIYGLTIQNTTLTDFSGLNALETISGDVTINNISMTDIPFLAGFTAIEGNISLSDNTALTDISALSTLEEIDGSIEITNNDALTTLSGLDNIVANTIANLVIENNDNLSLCNMEAVCIYLANGFPASISGNDTGCATILEVEGTCDTAVCPPGDLELLTQDEVDYFALQYPNCTEINGNLGIGNSGSNSDSIIDLQPFQNITSVTGGVSIKYTSLTGFNGLHNLVSIGGLGISFNDNIINLQGFDSLETISGALSVYWNENIETFTGMETLIGIDRLNVFDNPSLLNIDGINNIGDLISVDATRSIYIGSNDNLQNIDALSGVTHASHAVNISNNPLLEDVSGLTNLTQIGDPNYFSSFRIQNNHSLTTLNFESLEVVYGKFSLFTNDNLQNIDGLSSLHTVWGFTIQENNSLESIVGFSSLTTAVRPGLETSEFEINSNSVLTSLNGLENVTKAGDVEIGYNDALTSYEGLAGLEEVGHSLWLRGNPLVTNLNGLENLTETGVEPHNQPVSFLIWNHDSLTNIEALSNLVSLNNSTLLISGNPQLTSLSGLDNVDPTSIAYLELLESENLSYCEVASVCDFIANAPASAVVIGNNATGCNTVVEVEDACALGTDEMALGAVSIYPNPATDFINIVVDNAITIEHITLYDINGKQVHKVMGAHSTIAVSHLDNGLYFVRVVTNKGTHYQRVIKK